MEHLLTFIGFGEAAYHIAKGLSAEGMTGMVAYDMMQDSETAGPVIRRRAAEAGVTLAAGTQEACQGARFVLSLTSAAVCVKVAQSVLPLLKEGQTYVDMNSAAPTAMTEIDQLPRPEGVDFCDVAMMGSVPAGGHQTKMFLSGSGAQAFFTAMQPFHTKMNVLDTPAGSASALKMFKSVFSKGLPQLLLECFVPAAKYGVLDEILSSVNNTFKEKNIEQYADKVLFRTLIHAQRRSGEMRDAAQTVESMGLDASMSRAAQHKLEELGARNFKEKIGPDEQPDLRKVIELLLEND